MVVESGTRSEVKASLFKLARNWPIAGFTYDFPTFNQLLVVLAEDSMWVHVVTWDLHSSTSIPRGQWDFYARHNIIKKTETPWQDMTETRRSLLGS